MVQNVGRNVGRRGRSAWPHKRAAPTLSIVPAVTNPTLHKGSSTADSPSSTRPHIDPTTSTLSTPAKVALAVIGLVFLACASPKPDTNAGAAGGGQASTGGAPAANEAGATKDNPAPVGTEVTPAKGWTITVTAPATDATAEIVKANQFNKPKVPTNKLYSVPVSIHNGSDRPGMALGELKLGALPPNGVRVDQVFAVTGYPTIETTAQLQPGATVAGKLVYELDPTTFGQTVLLAEPQFTLDTNADQRFLALQ